MSTIESWDQPSFAALAQSRDAGWDVRLLPSRALLSLDELIARVRDARSEGAVVGLACVEDDWIAVARPVPGGVRLLLSDATAALDYDLAADILDELDVDQPDDEDADSDEAWPEGDFALLEDLGASEQVMSVILDDDDLYGAAQLLRVADELGFADELADAAGLDLDEYLDADGDYE